MFSKYEYLMKQKANISYLLHSVIYKYVVTLAMKPKIWTRNEWTNKQICYEKPRTAFV